MKNILLINGHEYYPFSPGRLNKTIFDEMVSQISKKYEVKTTVVQDGYDIKEEQEKFKWADTIVYQTPIYWFSLPGMFKKYIDEVYEYGVFFGGSEEGYGKGGLMTGKKYMFSTTWNAPEGEYNHPEGFFKGQDLEGALEHLHRTQSFVGMEPLKSFGAQDVVANPDIDKYLTELRQHLKEVFHLEI
ncbi:NAD(P)H-dependent oxidoreductase [Rossellomorea aquimaris]|uniref:NAD(P)H-dependent oxidoreductase n=1 Tax=Rossellomorea aquimaris TaxID=189382 RepID=UPI0005CA92A0|nr:NAD(P)H-dependent oxidoreductase [Rossellomorea aquimaris]